MLVARFVAWLFLPLSICIELLVIGVLLLFSPDCRIYCDAYLGCLLLICWNAEHFQFAAR